MQDNQSISFFGKREVTLDSDDIPAYIQANQEIAAGWESEVGGTYCRLCLDEVEDSYITCACRTPYCHSCSELLGYKKEDDDVLDIESCDMCAEDVEEIEEDDLGNEDESSDEVEAELVEQALEESVNDDDEDEE
jgi:hypothetical protein